MKKIIEVLFEFTKKMLVKLNYQYTSNWRGWDDNPDFTEKEIIRRMEHKLREISTGKSEEVDLANYCLFLWYNRNAKQLLENKVFNQRVE